MNIGNKGDWLVRLAKADFPVPRFVALDHEFFLKLLKEVNGLEIAQLISVKSAWIKENFLNLRNTIKNEEISDSIIGLINDKASDLRFPVSVRSSASVEDGNKKSAAGVYKSLLNIDKDSLVASVREVIASLYNENCIIYFPDQDFHPSRYYMGVVIQEMIESDYSGVAFTVDPNTGDSSEILVEMSEGLGDKIVSGVTDVESYSIPKWDDFLIKDKIKKNILDELRFWSVKAEELARQTVDLEWAYANNKLYILQCRPITTVKPKPNIDKIDVFSMSKLSSDTFPYLGLLQKKYPKWLKKAKFYDFCEINNINTVKWKFVVFNKELLKALDYKSIFNDYDSRYVSYHLNSQTVHNEKINSIPDILENFTDIYKDNSYCVDFREFLPNELAAISSVNQEEQVQIECINGKMFSLNTGAIVPTRYLLDKDNRIIELNIEEQQHHIFDEEQLDLIPTDCNKIVELPYKVIESICVNTKKFNGLYGPCAVEWWVWKDKLYAADICLLKSEDTGTNTSIISKGKAKGKLYKLPELDEGLLRELNMFNTISVVDSDFDLDRVDVLKALKNTLEEWNKKSDIILYCERPYIFLSPFKKYISGFVFNNASNLCHLSLIIREAGIPAISLNGEKYEYSDGQMCELDAEEGVLRLI